MPQQNSDISSISRKPTELLTSPISAVNAPIHGKVCLAGSFSAYALCYIILVEVIHT